MANKLFQNVIYQMKDAIDKQFGVIDEYNKIIACSDINLIGEKLDVSVDSGTEVFVYGEYTLKPIPQANNVQFTVFVKGNDFICNRYAHIIAVAFANIKNYYDEKYDRSRFVKDIILDNVLPGDIYLKARELYFESDVARAVIVMRNNELTDVSVLEVLQSVFPQKNKDFVISINDKEAVIVKEINENITHDDLQNLALSIAETLESELGIRVSMGIGTTVANLKSLARSYKEAQMAIEVGKFFDSEKTISSYDNLGIARLVYQLPTTLCELFLGEIFKYGSINILDEETLFTIQKFFENNLNVSEAARSLFIHRNTLLYRIEKVKKVTGLDLKTFDHAAVFKIALMVNKYLKNNPIKYYNS